MPQPGITAMGLGLDILGAGLIAIPDLKSIFSKFPAGALAAARDRMVFVGTKEEDNGFVLLCDILEELEPVAEFGAVNDGEEYVQIQVNSLTGMQSAEAAEHPDFDWGDRYVEARYSIDGGWDETDFYDIQDVFDGIESRERPQTAQLRLYGLLILLCGFAFQLLATLDANPNYTTIIAIVAIVLILGIHRYRYRLD